MLEIIAKLYKHTYIYGVLRNSLEGISKKIISKIAD